MKNQIDYESKLLLEEQFYKRFGITEYEFSDNPYSRWDTAFIRNNIAGIIEMKVRRCKSTTYSDTLLNLDKYLIMRKIADKVRENNKFDRVIPYYIALFEDCYYVFNLDRIDVKRGRVVCSKTTDFEDDRMLLKEVIYINFNQGIKYEYK